MEHGIESLLRGVTMRVVRREEIVRRSSSADLIKFAVDVRQTQSDGGHSVENEWLWAERVAPDAYKVDNITFFSCEFSFGDVVSLAPNSSMPDETLVFAAVISHEGHSTYRIRLHDEERLTPADKYLVAGYVKLLADLGCDFETGTGNLVAVDAAAAVNLDGVHDVLSAGLEDEIWDFEAGHVFVPAAGPYL